MIKEKTYVQGENLNLLMEIFNLKVNLEELYNKKGSDTSDYISLSIKLNVLMKEYFEEKMDKLMNSSKDDMIQLWEQNGLKQPEYLEVNQKLDELINKYQHLQKIV